MEVHSPQGEHKPEMWEELTFQSVTPPGAWEPMDPLSHPTDEQIYTLYHGIKPDQKHSLERASLLLGTGIHQEPPLSNLPGTSWVSPRSLTS